MIRWGRGVAMGTVAILLAGTLPGATTPQADSTLFEEALCIHAMATSFRPPLLTPAWNSKLHLHMSVQEPHMAGECYLDAYKTTLRLPAATTVAIEITFSEWVPSNPYFNPPSGPNPTLRVYGPVQHELPVVFSSATGGYVCARHFPDADRINPDRTVWGWDCAITEEGDYVILIHQGWPHWVFATVEAQVAIRAT